MQGRYTREFVLIWLRHWDLLSRKAADDLDWAEIHADFVGTAKQLSIDRRWAFVLHFGIGRTPREIYRIKGWSIGYTLATIRSVEKDFCRILLDDGWTSVFEANGAYPGGWVGGGVGPWDLPLEAQRH